jgi:hypothetical protein
MNRSTIIGLKLGATAAAAWFVLAFALINLGLREEFVFLVLGLAALPVIAVVSSRVAYAAGKSRRNSVELPDA